MQSGIQSIFISVISCLHKKLMQVILTRNSTISNKFRNINNVLVFVWRCSHILKYLSVGGATRYALLLPLLQINTLSRTHPFEENTISVWLVKFHHSFTIIVHSTEVAFLPNKFTWILHAHISELTLSRAKRFRTCMISPKSSHTRNKQTTVRQRKSHAIRFHVSPIFSYILPLKLILKLYT